LGLTLLDDKYKSFKEMTIVVVGSILIFAIYLVQLGGFSAVNISYATSGSLTLLALVKYNTEILKSQICLLAAAICSIPCMGGYEESSLYIMTALLGILISLIRVAYMIKTRKMSLPKKPIDRLSHIINAEVYSVKLSIFWELVVATLIISALLNMSTYYIGGGGFEGLEVNTYNYNLVSLNSMIVALPFMGVLVCAFNLYTGLIVRAISYIFLMYLNFSIYIANPNELNFLYNFVIQLIMLISTIYSIHLDAVERNKYSTMEE